MELAAGPLTLEFDPKIAFVRYIRLGDTEILRGVHVAVRDASWNTVVPRISNLDVACADNGFKVSWTAECVEGELDYVWEGLLTGAADGTIVFAMDGRARSTFLRNRIGLCVLHPLKECAGRPCAIETSGGRQASAFPLDIAPHQPFKDLRAITHEVIPGVRADVRFEGDIFETEDHRNWTDANFKTYSTPLELPIPARVTQGTVIAQQVTVRLLHDADVRWPQRVTRSGPVQLEFAGEKRRLPLIGFGAPDRQLTAGEQKKLSAIRPAHLRVDLCLYREDWRTRLGIAFEAALAVGAKLECAVTVDDHAVDQLQSFSQELPVANVARVFVFHKDETSTSARWVQLARAALPAAVPVGAGTKNHFVDINRHRPPVESIDAICYSTHPQVHAWDDVTSIENLEGQAQTVRSARGFVGTKWIAVGPVTLKIQTPNSPFGCSWTLGSLAALAEAGADSVTYYQLVGPDGLVDNDDVLPLYTVFREVAEFAGGWMTPLRSSEPLAVGAMFLHDGQRETLLIANYTPSPQSVRVPGGEEHTLQPYEIASYKATARTSV